MDKHSRGLPSEGVRPSPGRIEYGQSRMVDEPFLLDDQSRPMVDAAIRATCEYRAWRLSALNVRTNHVHAVIAAPVDPAIILQACKAAATRAIREAGVAKAEGRVWTRHGSTRWLWNERDVSAAWEYVVNRQS